jgi:hypothetical protein
MHEPRLAGHPLDRTYHVCALFNSREEEYRVLGPFFREGIEKGEKVLHIIDPVLRADHLDHYRRLGMHVDQALEQRQLEILTWHEAYLKDGFFDQDRMLATVSNVIEAGREQGYQRLRLMGNMAWVLLGKPGSEQLIEYECRVNDVLTRTQQPAICVYDINHLSGAMVMDLLRAHPLTLIGGTVYENPFFTPPEQFLRELRARRIGRAVA